MTVLNASLNKSGVRSLRSLIDFAPGIIAAFSTRHYKRADRVSFVRACGLNPERYFTIKQTHSDQIYDVSEKSAATDSVEADALITDETGVTLGIQTADCVPAFICAPQARAIGLVHAGWKGLHKGILAKTIAEMVRKFQVEPGSLKVMLGPFIHGCCYEVGEELTKFFPSECFKTDSTGTESKLKLDLFEAARQQLMTAGLKDSQVKDSGICTYCGDADVYSARREQTQERTFSIIHIVRRNDASE